MTLSTKIILLLSLSLFLAQEGNSQKKKKSEEEKAVWKSSDLGGLKFRSIGPAFNSGRISDLVVNPDNHSEYYLTAASGGVWKTTNHGTTFKPIFDSQGSYSIGCITMDPSNSNVLWVGTGENNNQRSVAYGDGIYKSEDGGSSWKNMGLKTSEHIHKIIVHPNNSNVVFAAVAGPLWSPGGERGIYKTVDGGESWERLLEVSENTGFTDLVMDPRNPDVLYAASHQRRRHVFTYVGGGPESSIYKSNDGGSTWKKAAKGLPSVDIGRIGLAISPADPEYIYAIVEAAEGKGGFYRSTNRAASWEKRSAYSTSGNYYQEIVCDPKNADKVFSLNTYLHHSIDGGKNFVRTGESRKHVDNHAMWINPQDSKHWLVGCDGGLYETWDAAKNWQYKANLPITQFYKVAVDQAEPFYNVYGGTQDNWSLGGPSRTIKSSGITNADWIVTNGGDGFESQIDPTDPNIVYAQSQYGHLVRYDKKSGQRVPIQPQPGEEEKAYRWNWDAPLLISPHNHKRLYFAANILFRSDDRGDSWKAISGDLSQQLDRNQMEVMGMVQRPEAVMKNMSTSIFGNCVALDESPLVEGLIYVGTDDGLIQITEDGGEHWRAVSEFPGVPKNTYVNMIIADKFDENTVYACFNNHKNGDFKPYILKSDNRGKNWTAIHSNLPERGSVYALAQDHIKGNLMFAGTEFGFFFTYNGGANWIRVKSGLPTIAVRDIAIQSRESDIVLATFGRGFYILDDYSPLRELSDELKEKPYHLFSVKPGLLFMESNPLGGRGKGYQGESFYMAHNPEIGLEFSLFVKEKHKSSAESRKSEERKRIKEGTTIDYPDVEELRKEKKEEAPALIFQIEEENGEVLAKIRKSYGSGLKRVVWNGRESTTTPVSLSWKGKSNQVQSGQMVVPGTYFVRVFKSSENGIEELINRHAFEIKWLNLQSLPAEDLVAWKQYMTDVSVLRRSVRGAANLTNEFRNRLKYIRTAIENLPGLSLEMLNEVKELESKFDALSIQMNGDRFKSGLQMETKPGLMSRLERCVWGTWYATSAPGGSFYQSLEIASKAYELYDQNLDALIIEIEKLEKLLDDKGVPYTPGRDSDWKEN